MQALAYLTMEHDLKATIGNFASQYRIGQWLLDQPGIGPIIAGGLCAVLNIEKARQAGAFWRFCGADPKQKWKKGELRPWSALAKQLAIYHAGESFIKHKKKTFYGPIYDEYRDKLSIRNQRGQLRELALEYAPRFAPKDGKPGNPYCFDLYSRGFIIQAHEHAMGRRFIAKLFLSHIFTLMYEEFHGKEAPLPEIFRHPAWDTRVGGFEIDHTHYIPPPGGPNPLRKYDGKSVKELVPLFVPIPPQGKKKKRNEDPKSEAEAMMPPVQLEEDPLE